MEGEFENGTKSKVVYLVNMYNFGVLSFQSFNGKFTVILIFSKIQKVSLLISNSNFKNYVEFGKGQNMKSVDLEKLSNFCFYRFSTSIENLKVIWKFLSVAFS
jgi:hypothetical protein